VKAAARWNDAIARLLPFLLVVAIATCGYFWLVQPRLGTYLRTRTDIAALYDRVRTLQQTTDRARALPPADMLTSMREFERRMSRDDKVADVAGALAKAVLDSAPPDKLRGFAIETGDRVQQTGGPAGRSTALVAAGTTADAPDPRVLLFETPVIYTPVRISFESTFEAGASFLWKIRDLPTTVEIRSASMTRGLPLMKVDVLVRVYQRGDTAEPVPLIPAGEPASTPAGPTAPRVAEPTGAGGREP
jgi:hypothetical protein